MTRKQVGKERVHLAYTSTVLFIIERTQARKETRGRNSKRSHKEVILTGLFHIYWLVPYRLLSLLSYNTWDNHPRYDTTNRDLFFPVTIINPEKQPTG